ncbi:hypothetical protein [Rhizobium leguminosarum]|uniref:hypothetical protein n=1 Tax=Rhizobium leguminosarum TaxID=384 RepID=UPI0015D9E90E|nr:hypothetical protein [Rhizobium leguminosarum]NZD53598.1 hypothetical protein [Rhizobium leguminosarum]
MASKNFQIEVLGASLAFPYQAGQGATIVSVQPAMSPVGTIRDAGGFVGLDIGDRATVSFEPPAVAFRVSLYCGANPTKVTVTDTEGTPSPPLMLQKGPLQTGTLCYAGDGITTVILSQSNHEGRLLRLDWENIKSATTVARSDHSIMSQEQVAGIVYARTAGWRASATKSMELEEARVMIASTILSDQTTNHKAIIPRESDLRHPLLRSIWQSCLDAAALAASKVSSTQVKFARVPYTGSELGLGPFIDLGSRGAEIMLVQQLDMKKSD